MKRGGDEPAAADADGRGDDGGHAEPKDVARERQVLAPEGGVFEHQHREQGPDRVVDDAFPLEDRRRALRQPRWRNSGMITVGPVTTSTPPKKIATVQSRPAM